MTCVKSVLVIEKELRFLTRGLRTEYRTTLYRAFRDVLEAICIRRAWEDDDIFHMRGLK